MNKIKGLNLGGWLVLEKWMTPELFASYDAKDEYNLLKELADNRFAILKKHRDTFITQEDFKWISDYGIDTVRIPVGYWLFEADFPYLSAREYVGKAFLWAEKYGLKILLDVHAASGCQNGFDNGGLSGICEWHLSELNINKTIDFIEKLTKTYQSESALLGIQVLNEPRWDIDIKLIQDFYLKSYNIIRRYLDSDYIIVFHDSFRLFKWKDFFEKNNLSGVILDTHMYQVFSHNDALRNPKEVIHKVSIKRLEELKRVLNYVDIVVGEWSLGIHKNTLEKIDNKHEEEAFYQAVGSSLLATFEQVKGWFFWSYKLSEESTKKNIGWSFRDIVSKGYIPNSMKGVLK